MNAVQYVTPVVLLFLVLALLSTYCLIRSSATTWVKYLLVLVLPLSYLFVTDIILAKLGYAVPLQLPEKAPLLHFNVVWQESRPVNIELWLQEPKETRLYVIPYSKESEKKLKQGQKQAKEGGGVLTLRGNRQGLDPQDLPLFETEVLVPNVEAPKDEVVVGS